jgi:hypothetical protein
MKKRTKWILSVVGIVVVGCGTDLAWQNHKKIVLYREQEAVDEQILTAMRREFPAGTPRAEVLSGLKGRYPGVSESDPEIDIWLGHEPSFVWYCSYMQPYLVFKFQTNAPSSPLLEIERHTTGECL